MPGGHKFEDSHATAASISVDEDPNRTSVAKWSEPMEVVRPLRFDGKLPHTTRTSASNATASHVSAAPTRLECGSATQSSTTISMHGSDTALAETTMSLATASAEENVHHVSSQSLEERLCDVVRAAVHQVTLEATAQLRATAAELQQQHAHCCSGGDTIGGQVAGWRSELQDVLEEFRNKLLKFEKSGPPPKDTKHTAATPSCWPRKASASRDSVTKQDCRQSCSPGRQKKTTEDACTDEEVRWLVSNLGLSRRRATSQEFPSRVIVNAPASVPAPAPVPPLWLEASGNIPSRRSGCSPVDESQQQPWPGLQGAPLAWQRSSVVVVPPITRSHKADPAASGKLSVSSSAGVLSAYSATPTLANNVQTRLGGSLTARQSLTSRQHVR